MYATHGKAIQQWVSANGSLHADRLADVLTLAMLTAHQPFHNAPADMEAVRNQSEDAKAVLFGWKARSYAEIQGTKDDIAWNVADILHRYDGRERENYLLQYVASIHGFAFTKAGFALQMAFGVSGCLDTHNLRDHGLNAYIIRARIGERPYKLATLYRRVDLYNQTVANCGGTASLWDTWCEGMAARYPKRYRDGFHVSSLHCEALGI